MPCGALEFYICRPASGSQGRQGRQTWRTVEAATRLVFKAVEAGSVAAVLGLPAARDQVLSLDDESLGEFAVATTMAVLTGEGHDAAVAIALVQLADELGVGSRHERLVFIADKDSAPRREAQRDVAELDRLRQASAAARMEDERPLPGILVEADFERSTARLRYSDRRRSRGDVHCEQADESSKLCASSVVIGRAAGLGPLMK